MALQQRQATITQQEVVTETVNETVSTVTLAPVGANTGGQSSARSSRASLFGLFLILASSVLAM